MSKKSRRVKLPKTPDGHGNLLVSKDPLSRHFRPDSVSISLKYYKKSCECFSEWKGMNELQKFSSIIEKISGYTADNLKKNKSLCSAHKGPPKKRRFRRPANVSKDYDFYEIKVDSSNAARIHGFFIKGVFFLVWLDRKHECFPE